MISLCGLVVLCAAAASCTTLVKKDFLKSGLQCGTFSHFKTTLLETPIEMPTRCVYSFRRNTPEVNQLRIEMEVLQLMQPQEVEDQPDQMICVNRLIVNDIILCGKNDGQHLYVPFDHTQVSLVFEIPVLDPQSKWKLNVTQLESGEVAVKKNLALRPLANGLENLKKVFAMPNKDAMTVAPAGCNQYFIARTGTVESFNYNDGAGPYMSNQSYAICFKRYMDSTAVELTFIDFGLPNGGIKIGLDADCHSAIPTPGRQEDYLSIPGASLVMNGATVHPYYFCGTSTSGNTVTFGQLGPFVMYFHSDELVSVDNRGFKINYKIV